MGPDGYATWCLSILRMDISEDVLPLYINFSGRTELGELQEHVVSALRGHAAYNNDRMKEELGDVAFLLYAKCALHASELPDTWSPSGKIIKTPGVRRLTGSQGLLEEANECAEGLSDAFKKLARPELHLKYMERLCACLGWGLPDVIFMNRIKIVQRTVDGTLINKEKRAHEQK